MDRQAPVLLHLASNLKRLRRDAGISQDALAARSGVSRRMLVAIEAGDSNVSLQTLDKIAHALGVLLPDLIVDPALPGRPTLAWRGEKPGSEAKLLVSVPATRLAEMWEWQLAPGDRYESGPDPDGWHEMVVVISGTLTMAFDGRTSVLAAGAAAAYRSDRPFAFANQGEEPVRFIRNVVL